MTVDELREYAGRGLAFGAKWIGDHNGDLPQMFHLIKRDGSVDLLMIDGSITNSAAAKDRLSRLIRARVAAGEVEAVIMLSDTFFARISPENEKIRRALNMNVEEASAFGLCEKQEAIVVMLESPIYQQILKQEYRRDPKDGSKITLVGEPLITDDTDPTMKMEPARFTGYFPQEARRQ